MKPQMLADSQTCRIRSPLAPGYTMSRFSRIVVWKKYGVLRDDAEPMAHIGGAAAAQIHVAAQDGALIRIVQTQNIFASVLLPEPDGPTSATRWP